MEGEQGQCMLLADAMLGVLEVLLKGLGLPSAHLDLRQLWVSPCFWLVLSRSFICWGFWLWGSCWCTSDFILEGARGECGSCSRSE